MGIYNYKLFACNIKLGQQIKANIFKPCVSKHEILQRYCSSDRGFYEQTKKGIYEGKTGPKMKYNMENLKMGMSEIRTEVKKWRDEMEDKFEADPIFIRPGDTDKVFDFKSSEDLDKWVVTADSDFKQGFSNGSLELSPTGHGLFSGNIDLRVPKDGVVKTAGYCNITSKLFRKSFKRECYHDWSIYTHLVLRVRGDGRRYLLVINTSGYYDILWNDRFQYVLHSRGGPYWQNVKIPFSKFLLTGKGKIQDKQFPIPLNKIKNFGITCSDRIPNTFRLEIDSISLHYDNTHTEESAYEMYQIPAFIV